MKSEIFCLVLMFLCVGCFSSKSSIQQDSRFKSAELKQEISYLIPLLKRSQTSPGEISIRILITPEFIYPQILSMRSEEHTSELQSRENLVCRLLLEKKKLVRIRNRK